MLIKIIQYLDQLQLSRDLESRFNSLNRTYLLLCWEVEEVKPRTEMRVSSGENSNLHKINAVIPPLPPIFETTTCAALGTIELLSRSSLLESNRSSALSRNSSAASKQEHHDFTDSKSFLNQYHGHRIPSSKQPNRWRQGALQALAQAAGEL